MSDPLAALIWDAFLAEWPSHLEGSASYPPSPLDRTWKVLSPALPDGDTADRMAAYLVDRGVTLQPTAPAEGLREAFLAGVRRGASDGMEAYPEVADDYLATPQPAAPAEGLDVERLTNLVRAQRDAYKARHSTSRARDVGVAAFDVVLAAIAREYAKETSE